MQKHTCMTARAQRGVEMVELQVEKGNRLHDQAIFDFFARMVSRAALPVGKEVGMACQSMTGSHHGQRLPLTGSHRTAM